jgi:hypothetical protein
MIPVPSRAVALFGTEEPVEPPRILRAGPLSAEVEAGNLRYIRYGGAEMLRAVSFIVRDRNWGTYNPKISNLKIEEHADGFRVTYDAVTQDEQQALAYSAEITGDAQGSLRFAAEGVAERDFLTNRAGFVVLHPIEGVAGAPVTIEHTDGSVAEGRFPELIDPIQPMMDLRALTHEFSPGVRATCRMEGDTFEMEDQRNWTDASYKTYVRPLALPWPYTLAAGTKLRQSVTLTVSGAAPSVSTGSEITISVGEPSGLMPPLGIGLDPAELEGAFAAQHLLKAAGLAHVLVHHDPRRGHDLTTLERGVAFARAVGAKPVLEAVIASVDDWESEVAGLGRMATALGSPFVKVLVSPAPDLKCTLPGSTWPPCPPAVELYRAVRAAFPGVQLGGGMFSYFTELNRKRPPLEELDFVSFTTNPLVHAGDDRTALENLETLPHIARSVRAIVGKKPWHVGPSSIEMRDNPYGAAPMENPRNIRQAMNGADPRQRGLFAAAWNLGHIAHFAQGGASRLTVGGAVGKFGLAYAPTKEPQPWYDEAGGLYPVFHVFRGLAALGGRTLYAVEISRPHDVQALAVSGDGGTELWIANLTTAPVSLTLATTLRESRLSVLDQSVFVAASQATDAVDRAEASWTQGTLELDALAVARIRSLS